MAFKERQWPAFNSLLAIWSEDGMPIALGLVGLGLFIIFVVGLFTWRDPSINWDVIASQVQLFISDI